MKKFKTTLFVLLTLSVIALAFWAIFVTAATDFKSPTVCAPQPPNVGWMNCGDAFGDGGSKVFALGQIGPFPPQQEASNISFWSNYNFNIPTNNQINSVVVRLDANGTASNHLTIRVSRDGGITWGPLHISPNLGVQENTFLIDVTGDFQWAPADLSNGNFKVEVACIPLALPSSCTLDWVPVQVISQPTQISVPSHSYLPFVSDETVLQRNDWLQTEEQFVSFQGNPSQYTMMRNGAVTGISIHCERAPVSCATNPTVEARITAGGNLPPSQTGVISVSLPSTKNAAYTVIAGASFNAGDTISVYAGDYGNCNTQPAWCTVLVETTVSETITLP